MDAMPAWTLDQVAGLAFGVTLQVARSDVDVFPRGCWL